MRTWIERVEATDSRIVANAIDRWKAMERHGWNLTTTHHYKPRSELTTFGYLDESRPWMPSDHPLEDDQLTLDVDARAT